MITRYTEEELKGRKYLFVSYSHADEPIIQNAVNYLINEGVQIWYDADLHNGESWIERAEGILTSTDCIGVIFFNSKKSFASNAVAQEREITIKKQEEWAKEGKNFNVFVVHIGGPSTMQIIKQVLDALPNDEKMIENTIGTPKLSRILKLFPQERLYSLADDEGRYLPVLYSDIDTLAQEAIDKTYVTIDKLCSTDSGKVDKLIVELGNWAINGRKTTLRWKYIKHKEDDMYFLCEDVLCEFKGGTVLAEWLNTEFKQQAFDSNEAELVTLPLQLLSIEEINDIEDLTEEGLKRGCLWWLADTKGNLQSVVQEDGTIYERGYINRKFELGVRPVLVLKREQAEKVNK